MSEPPERKRLAVLMSFSGAGGVEKMMLNLLAEFQKQPWLEVEVLMIRSDGPYPGKIPAQIRVRKLSANHSLSVIPELVSYLRQQRPDAILAAKDRAGRAAVIARSLAGVDTPIVVRLGTNLSASLEHRSALSRWLRLAPLRSIYRRVDRVVGNSMGVADDIQHLAQLPKDRVEVIRNPVVTPRILEQGSAPPPHQWLQAKTCPVVLAMGRLTIQKDFETLIRAFAEVQKELTARLIILGEGGLRSELEALIRQLGLGGSVLLPGHQENPYAWIARADLFVLSSRWEGSPNALTEAFALGVPCVSTDCPSGPAELLEQGRYGALVPVADVQAMASAMLSLLRQSDRPQSRESRLRDYQADVSAEKYLNILFPERGGSA